MIQRIQSLYLLLGGLAFLATLFFRSVLTQEQMAWVMPAALGLCVLVTIGTVALIFLYADRKRQLKLVSWLQYLAILAILAVFAGLYLSGGIMESTQNIRAMASMVLPVVGYVFIRLAGYRIHKDIELVRSMDRLR
jgi:hypothetical protein